MVVTLGITSYQKSALGADAEKTFQRSGGSFGRGQDNDWVLPDPERILSGHHGTIYFKDDGFWLKDESTNGIAVGARSNKIGRGQAIRLHNGLHLFFGEYEAVVALANELSHPPPASTAFPHARSLPTPPAVTPRNGYLHAPGQCRQGLAGAGVEAGGSGGIHNDRFDPLAALSAAKPSSERTDAGLTGGFNCSGRDTQGSNATVDETPDDHGSALEDPFVAPGVIAAPEPLRASRQVSAPLSLKDWELPEDWDATGLSGQAEPQRKAPPGRNEPPASTCAASSPASTDAIGEQLLVGESAAVAGASSEPNQKPLTNAAAEEFLRLFFRAGDMPAIKVEDAEALAMIECLGRMFASLVQGVMGLAKARADTKSELRLARTSLRQSDNNPLKIADGAEDALHLMFTSNSGRYLQGDQAVNQLVDDLQAHQVALISAMQASIDQLIKRVAPEHFGTKTGESGLFKALGTDSTAWHRYKDFYEHTLRDSSGAFKTLLGEHFVETYEQQVQRLNK